MDKCSLIGELYQGKELTEQLKNPASSLQTRLHLVEKILSSYDKALSFLNWNANFDVQHNLNNCSSDHPPVPNCSPTSDVSDQDYCCKDQAQNNVPKKRKTQQRWTEQVKVCSGTGVEGPVEDGHSWRKYGQKDILGAKFPRGYYRCTHRHSQGCLATKQVQRSDKDPSVFELTYRGRHTCVQASHLSDDSHHQKKQKSISTAENVFVVKSEELDAKDEIFPSFSLVDSISLFNKEYEDNHFVGSLISPATSESNYLSTSSSCHFDNFGIIGCCNVQTPESEITTDMASLPTSVTNSPIGDFDFDFSNLDFDANLKFDSLEFEFLAQ